MAVSAVINEQLTLGIARRKLISEPRSAARMLWPRQGLVTLPAVVAEVKARVKAEAEATEEKARKARKETKAKVKATVKATAVPQERHSRRPSRRPRPSLTRLGQPVQCLQEAVPAHTARTALTSTDK